MPANYTELTDEVKKTIDKFFDKTDLDALPLDKAKQEQWKRMSTRGKLLHRVSLAFKSTGLDVLSDEEI